MSNGSRSIGPIERALYLNSLEGMTELSHEDLARVAESAHERVFRDGTVIVDCGQKAEHLHTIVEGQLKLVLGDRVIRRFGPRESLGLLGVLAGTPSEFAVVAEGDVLTLEFDADDIFEAYEESFELWRHHLRIVARLLLSGLEGKGLPNLVSVLPTLKFSFIRELDLVERLLLLRHAGPFLDSSLDAIVDLARTMTEHRFRAGETIWRKGDPPGVIYVVASGHIRADDLPSGDSLVLNPGWAIGAIECFLNLPRWHDARAETTTSLLRLELDRFWDVVEDNPSIGRSYLSYMAKLALTLLHGEFAAPVDAQLHEEQLAEAEAAARDAAAVEALQSALL